MNASCTEESVAATKSTVLRKRMGTEADPLNSNHNAKQMRLICEDPTSEIDKENKDTLNMPRELSEAVKKGDCSKNIDNNALQRIMSDVPFCSDVEPNPTKTCSASHELPSTEKDEIALEKKKARSRRSSVRRSIACQHLAPVNLNMFGEPSDTTGNTEKSSLEIKEVLKSGFTIILEEMQKDCPSLPYFDEFRTIVLNNSEKICQKLGSDIAEGTWKSLSNVNRVTSMKEMKRQEALKEVYKRKYDVLRKEFCEWNETKKESRLCLKQAEREYKESLNRETKLEEVEVQKMLTFQEKEMLKTLDYKKFSQNAKLANVHVKTVNMKVQWLKRILSSHLKVTKAATDEAFDKIDKEFSALSTKHIIEKFLSSATAVTTSDQL